MSTAYRGPLGALDYVRQFDHGAVRIIAYPSALEASATNRFCIQRKQPKVAAAPPTHGASENERIQRALRAATARRYAVANDLRSHLVLTIAGKALARQTVAHEAQTWLRRSKRPMNWRFPYLWVVEGGTDTDRTRCHVHALVPTSAAAAASAQWRLGHANTTELTDTDGVRAAACYLVKSLPVGDGRQQLRTGCGFKPESVTQIVERPEQARQVLEAVFGSAPERMVETQLCGVPVGQTLYWNS